MSGNWETFDRGLGRMGEGMRRAHAGFGEADAGFIEAYEGLKQITLERGSLDKRMTDMAETIARLEKMLLEQTRELKALQERLNGGSQP